MLEKYSIKYQKQCSVGKYNTEIYFGINFKWILFIICYFYVPIFYVFLCGKICTVSVKKQIIRNEIINKYRFSFRKHIFGLETYFSGNFIENYKNGLWL